MSIASFQPFIFPTVYHVMNKHTAIFSNPKIVLHFFQFITTFLDFFVPTFIKTHRDYYLGVFQSIFSCRVGLMLSEEASIIHTHPHSYSL